MIDLPALKAALNIPEGYTEHDDYLVVLEAAAVSYVQRRTGWYWGAQQEVEVVLCGSGTRNMWLPDHASAVSRVVERSDYGVDSELPAESYALRPEPGSTHGIRLVRLDGIWHPGAEYAVTYTRGYAPGEEPADIRQAVTGLVAHWFEHRLPVATAGLSSAPVPDHVAAILAAHRKGQV